MTHPTNEPLSRQGRGALLSEVISLFTSVRTTVTLLFLLAGASVVGTIIPQPTSLDQLRRATSPFVFRLIAILDLNDLFRSWWFLGLLALLALNLLACLAQRVSGILSEWRSSSVKPIFTFSVIVPRPVAEVQVQAASAVRHALGSLPVEINSGDEIVLSWVKHRVHLLGFPLVHCAIFVILAGGLIGLLYGFKGHVSIGEGESKSTFTLIRTGEIRSLPFEIAVDRFVLTRYPSGEPREYRSDVRLLENGQEVLRGPILVNSPLTFRGISLYQADYRPLGVRGIVLGLVGPDGTTEEFFLEPYTDASLPGADAKTRLMSVDPGTTQRGVGAEIQVSVPGEEPRTVQVFDGDREPAKVGRSAISFRGVRTGYATGLQVGYDPGAIWVWVGCIMLIAGFCLTLFTNHRRLTVVLRKDNSKTLVKVSGSSRKLKAEFRTMIEGAVLGVLKASPTPFSSEEGRHLEQVQS